MTGTLGLAFGAGMLATVSPCGLAMLPAFLAYYVGTDSSGTVGRGEVLRRSVYGLRTGVVVSLGFIAVFIATALVVTAGLRSVVEAVPWVAVGVGVVLVAVGLALLAGRRVGVTLNSSRISREGRGPGSMLAYGAAYAVASLSCSLGVLLALIGQALTTSSTTRLLGVYTAFAAGNATVLVLLALSAALASGGLAKVLKQSSRYLPRVTGGIVVLSGLYMVVYWMPALTGGSTNRTLASKVMPTTGAINDFLRAHTGTLGVVAVTAILTIVVWALWSARHVQAGVTEADDAASNDQMVKSE